MPRAGIGRGLCATSLEGGSAVGVVSGVAVGGASRSGERGFFSSRGVLDGKASTHKAVRGFYDLRVTQIAFFKYYGVHILKRFNIHSFILIPVERSPLKMVMHQLVHRAPKRNMVFSLFQNG